ncbi:MAG: hypothetical protein LIP09_06070 [Bacteroidales bacterium]|nr:hypothetical protein [Bacteroidales bacterium]
MKAIKTKQELMDKMAKAGICAEELPLTEIISQHFTEKCSQPRCIFYGKKMYSECGGDWLYTSGIKETVVFFRNHGIQIA